MTVRDDLIAAKALIDTPEKWCQGTATAGYGARLCAIRAAGGARYRNKDAVAALKAALPIGEKSLPRFNDSPDTTHADVMALFDRAIEAAAA